MEYPEVKKIVFARQGSNDKYDIYKSMSDRKVLMSRLGLTEYCGYEVKILPVKPTNNE